jgi:hypothetical protein
LVPRVAGHAVLSRSFLGAATLLAIWQIALFARLAREGAERTVRIQLRPQHYVQAAVQLSVFAFWGWFWRPVYDMAWLIAGQLAFAYAFDILLAWTRREGYTLGFGPFPIIFSINLFLWFRDDWFYLQFVMIAVGILGKEFVRWRREDRTVHIFNPSAFSLGLFSLALIVTGTTDLTWGPEIAATLTLAPRIYLFLFSVGLVVMYFFSITLVAASAAGVLFGLSALYFTATGVPYFLDSEIPAAVFLGLHLLVTDPSTSPRTPAGKIVFGGLYGLGVFGLYALLGAVGAPTFYDKLLCVPLLNLAVRRIDALVATMRTRAPWERLRWDWSTRPANLAHIGAWVVFFGAMSAMGKTDGMHRGDALPFWQQACEEGRRGACDRLLGLEATYCADNSGWACNALGAQYAAGSLVQADPELARAYFSRACELRFQTACVSLLGAPYLAPIAPRELDLRLMLREGGLNLMDLPEPALFERACQHGWSFACESSRGAP